MDRLTSLAMFAAACDLGSFSQVAQRFGVTPAMVGKHIKALEAEAQGPLLLRTTRKHSLTPLGQEYLLSARRVLAELQSLKERSQALSQDPAGQVHINAPVTFGAHRVAPLVAQCAQHYPKLEIQLTLSDEPIDVRQSEVDLVIRIGMTIEDHAIARPLAQYAMTMAASPVYLAKHGTPMTFAQLKEHTWLRLSHWQKAMPLAQHFSQKGFDITQGRFVCSQGLGLKEAALAHQGIILQPYLLLKNDIEEGRLVALLADQMPSPLPVMLISRQRQPAVKVQIVRDYLLTHCPEGAV